MDTRNLAKRLSHTAPYGRRRPASVDLIEVLSTSIDFLSESIASAHFRERQLLSHFAESNDRSTSTRVGLWYIDGRCFDFTWESNWTSLSFHINAAIRRRNSAQRNIRVCGGMVCYPLRFVYKSPIICGAQSRVQCSHRIKTGGP